MISKYALIVAIALGGAGLTTAQAQAHPRPIAAARVSPEQAAVEAVLTDSVAGWNAGDMDRYMGVYSNAPDTSFVTPNGLLRGKATMIAHYRKRYDFTRAAKRGVLSLKTLDFRLLDPTHALFIGQYLLTYPKGKPVTGPTTLVFIKEKAGWRIIADHSS